jgi:hypothetical protein
MHVTKLHANSPQLPFETCWTVLESMSQSRYRDNGFCGMGQLLDLPRTALDKDYGISRPQRPRQSQRAISAPNAAKT